VNKIIVSVVIPTYNHEIFIREALESVLNQQVSFCFEVIVGDDGSKDDTALIIREYLALFPDIIVPVFRKNNIGGQLNRNDLYKRAKGKYIVVLDGDDIMYQGKLQKQVDFMERNPDYGSVFHNLDLLRNDKVVGQYCNNYDMCQSYSIEDFVEKGPFLPHSSKMFRKELLPKQGFPVFSELRGLDWLHHLCTSHGMLIGYIDDVLGAYRKHESSITALIGKGNLKHLYFGHLKALEYAEQLGVNNGSLEEGMRVLALSNLRNSLFYGDFEFYKFIIVELKNKNITLSIKNICQFYCLGDSKIMFSIRKLIYQYKNH
jgi:glycosyltransferase involved in cell wall biosynthesis